MRKPLSFELFPVWVKCYFSLTDVKIFFFVFEIFRSLTMICLSLHLFEFVTFEVTSFAKFGKLSAVIF